MKYGKKNFRKQLGTPNDLWTRAARRAIRTEFEAGGSLTVGWIEPTDKAYREIAIAIRDVVLAADFGILSISGAERDRLLEDPEPLE